MCVICVHVWGWVCVCVGGKSGWESVQAWSCQINSKAKKCQAQNAATTQRKAPGKGHEHNLLAAAATAKALEKYIFLKISLPLSLSFFFFWFTFCSLHQRFSLNADSSWNAWLAHWRLMLMLMMKVKQDSVPPSLCTNAPVTPPKDTWK